MISTTRDPALRRGLMRIGAFLLLLLVIAWLLQVGISSILRKLQQGDFGEWNRITQGSINAELLITGSSRAMTHYDPRILTERTGLSAYNIGLNGSQTDMQVARLETYLRHNRPPRLLIHNLDAFSFQVTHEEVYDPGQYIPYLHEPPLFSALRRIDPGSWKWRYIPLYGYATQDLRMAWLSGLMHWISRREHATHILGFTPREFEWTEDFERFVIANPGGVDVAIEPAGRVAMDDLLELCRRHGIQVALVYSPEYVQMQRITRNRDHVFSQFRELATSHGARFLDFSASPISEDQSRFYNSQHLNARGAEAFTIELAEALRIQ